MTALPRLLPRLVFVAANILLVAPTLLAQPLASIRPTQYENEGLGAPWHAMDDNEFSAAGSVTGGICHAHYCTNPVNVRRATWSQFPEGRPHELRVKWWASSAGLIWAAGDVIEVRAKIEYSVGGGWIELDSFIKTNPELCHITPGCTYPVHEKAVALPVNTDTTKVKVRGTLTVSLVHCARCTPIESTNVSGTIGIYDIRLLVDPETEEPQACQAPGPESGPQPPAPPIGAGEPVSLSTGNVFFSQTDLRVGELRLTRSFNGGRTLSPSRFSTFGPGWNSNLDARVRRTSPRALEHRDGSGNPQHYFDPGTGVYEAVLPYTRESTIQVTAGGYRRVFRHGDSETYDAAGRLSSTLDTRGVATTYTRDIRGRATAISRLNRSIYFLYQGIKPGPVQAFTGTGTVLAEYTYDARGALERVTFPDATGYRYQYNTTGRILAVDDLAGQPIERHDYDTQGRAITSEVAAGIEKLTFSYQPDRTVVTDALGNPTTYELTNVGGMRRVSRVTGPCTSCGGGGGDEQEWTYDAQGRITSYRTGPVTVASYTYDPATDDLIAETDALQSITRYTYDAQGRVLTRAAPDGGLTTYTYVAAGPQTITEKVNQTTSRMTRIDYGFLGLPERITDARAKVTMVTTNLFGDVIGVTPPPVAGQIAGVFFTYDERGRRTGVTDPLGHTTTATYDTRDRITRITAPDGSSTVLGYDGSGRQSSVTDPLGRVTRYEYDAVGRLESVTDPAGGVTRYQYDLMSRLTSLTDAKGQTTLFQYNSRGRVQRVTYPGGASETFTYDAAGRIAAGVDRKGVTTTFSYDAMGHLLGKTFSDAATPAATYGYDAVGRLRSAANGTDTLTWTYDLAGQVLAEASSLNTSTIGYTYDAIGGRLSVSLNGQVLTTYAYDDASRLTSLSDGASVFGFDYDTANRRTRVSYPNGAATSYTYDALSRLTNLTTVAGVTTLVQRGYTYDSAGDRTGMAAQNSAEAYTYDALAQLTGVDRTGSNAIQQAFGYDAVGNRLTEQQGGSAASATYNERNQLLTRSGTPASSYTYDANGNLTQKIEGSDTWTYQWDAENQLKRVLKNSIEQARFSYDALGRRVEKTAGAITATYTYDTEDVLRETAGGLSLTYSHGEGIDEPLAREDASGASIYYHADGLGSVVKISNQAGGAVHTYDYDAWGKVEAGTERGGFAFTGREWDPETGLYHYRARYYDPKVGRFISEDPIGFGGGDVNLYGYVWNNPPNLVDPEGLQGQATFGNGWHGRVDTFPFRGSTSFEIHVYCPSGEVGILGPDGWIKKHGFPGTEPDLPPSVKQRLNGRLIQELRARGLVLPKGQENIRPRGLFRPSLGRALGWLGIIGTILDAIEYSEERKFCKANPCACGGPCAM